MRCFSTFTLRFLLKGRGISQMPIINSCSLFICLLFCLQNFEEILILCQRFFQVIIENLPVLALFIGKALKKSMCFKIKIVGGCQKIFAFLKAALITRQDKSYFPVVYCRSLHFWGQPADNVIKLRLKECLKNWSNLFLDLLCKIRCFSGRKSSFSQYGSFIVVTFGQANKQPCHKLLPWQDSPALEGILVTEKAMISFLGP